jgi:nitronate monooxygenase
VIDTRLTRRFSLEHPIVSAPMAGAGGGRLAAAVSRAGGLGLIGGGYADGAWLETQAHAAGNEAVGVGFITWALAPRPEVREAALHHRPRALMRSFGDPAPFAARIAAAGVPLVAQVQSLRHAAHAADCGAAVIVAQGAEAGGHGARRATLTLVPEVADHLANHHPEVLLLAAGGIADGRGLAAALMLGADGVLVGSRFWASEEALVHANFQQAALRATGDDTLRSKVPDIARRLDWPEAYDIRTLRSGFTDRWAGDLPGLRAAQEAEAAVYAGAVTAGDAETAPAIVGEASGLFRDIAPAGALLARISAEAEALLAGGWRR